MALTTYEVGQDALIQMTFTGQSGLVIDPDTIECDVKPPSKASVAYVFGTAPQIARTSTGVYVLQLDINAAGTWLVYVKSTGQGKTAGVYTFAAKDKPF